jgi:hypothetical protein
VFAEQLPCAIIESSLISATLGDGDDDDDDDKGDKDDKTAALMAAFAQ